MSDSGVPPQRGDEQALFEKYADRLRRVTQIEVRTTPEIIDDACAFAWVQLLAHQPERPTVFPWLRTVARREAIRLDGMARRLLAYEEERAGLEFPRMTPNRGDVEEAQEMIEVRERLAELPQRQREIVFLHAAGWRYKDIGEHLGVTKSRVDQLMSRACARMREMDIREHEVTSSRARRLQEIERDPPSYITGSIGKMPSASPKSGGEELRREWKRLVLAIEDYRLQKGVQDPVLPLGRTTEDPEQARVRSRVSDFRRQRGLGRGLEL
jgi:RNA polymerase sigma factor (sigma-70 family)